MLTEEQIKDYARKGIASDAVDKAHAVSAAMHRMKEALDASPASGATASRLRPGIDSLMEALVALGEALDKIDAAREELR